MRFWFPHLQSYLVLFDPKLHSQLTVKGKGCNMFKTSQSHKSSKQWNIKPWTKSNGLAFLPFSGQSTCPPSETLQFHAPAETLTAEPQGPCVPPEYGMRDHLIMESLRADDNMLGNEAKVSSNDEGFFNEQSNNWGSYQEQFELLVRITVHQSSVPPLAFNHKQRSTWSAASNFGLKVIVLHKLCYITWFIPSFLQQWLCQARNLMRRS